MTASLDGLPGAELVSKGLADLAAGEETIEALLVSIGAPRLAELGFVVEGAWPEAEHRLYRALALREGRNAHAAYNALVRRLVSFERAAARRRR